MPISSAQPIHFIVEAGPDRGREISVPANGIRIGRSSQNDIVLIDPSASRFHCRFLLKRDDGLWVSDLASSNQTLVNGKKVSEARLNKGDVVTIGDTMLRVVNDGRDLPAGAGALPTMEATPTLPGGAQPESPRLDFGDKPADEATGRPSTRDIVRTVILLALVALAIAILAIQHSGRSRRPAGRETVSVVAPAAEPPFTIHYEKVAATASNIFRYNMEIGDALAVQIDDIQNKRHVRREKKMDPALVDSLVRSLETSGFFDLLSQYEGVAPESYDSWDLSVTIGRKTHRVKVVNHVAPEAFDTAREALEEFSKNELGLAALAVEPGKLVEMAHDALLQAKRLYDEREVRYGNLAMAIRAHKEAEIYLETIEPKPDFYPDIVAGRAECERDLQKRYDDVLFLAERAAKLRDWSEGARHLRILCEMVPDRSDERNKRAFNKLIDVERHLAPER